MDQKINPEDEESVSWMKRGIDHLQKGTPEASREAVRCFDQAIGLRRKLPEEHNPESRYKLAAGLMNRGDALTRLGVVEDAGDAINSYTEAIALLQDLPKDDGGLFIMRLAIAWINLGLALELKGDQAALEEAASSHQKAIDLLEASPLANGGEFILIKAGARINYVNALLRSSGDAESRVAEKAADVASVALSLLAAGESREYAAAEAGFKARHVLCRALIASLAAASPDDTRMELIGRLTDTVEDGLRLARDWERAGVPAFRALATRLFHVGALVYERSQPHFLADFLLDHVDPERETCIVPVDPGWLAMADESLSRVGKHLQSTSFELLATGQGKQRMELLGQLAEAQARVHVIINNLRPE